jgi:hypothetical protein
MIFEILYPSSATNRKASLIMGAVLGSHSFNLPPPLLIYPKGALKG